jgi:serine/threonine-protein kinase RsbW
MATAVSVKLVIPSQLRLVDLVHAASEKMAELAGFPSEDGLDVGMAVREAVINAIRHGNREDPALVVDVTMRWAADTLEVRVRDRGNGFDPAQVPDPRSGENLLRSSGRGLLLMRAFVDDVVFRKPRQGGTEVTLVKRRREPETAEPTDDDR